MNSFEAQDFLMNTTVEQKIFGHDPSEIYNAAIKELQRLESIMSFYRDTSEVSLLNYNAGKNAVKMSNEMMQILQQSKKYEVYSKNAFSVMLAPIIQFWRKSAEANMLPPLEDIINMLPLCDSDNLILDDTNGTAYLKKQGCAIDLGSIGKGFAADVCCEIYKNMGATSAFINLGGNVKAIGSRVDGTQWTVGVQHPDKLRGNCYCAVMCSNMSVVTSGGYERYHEISGTRYHHIIDGKKGYPSEKNLKSVTVLSECSAQADALSTAAFVLGLENGIDLIYDSKCVGAIFFTINNEVYLTKGMKRFFRPLEKLACYEVENAILE